MQLFRLISYQKKKKKKIENLCFSYLIPEIREALIIKKQLFLNRYFQMFRYFIILLEG